MVAQVAEDRAVKMVNPQFKVIRKTAALAVIMVVAAVAVVVMVDKVIAAVLALCGLFGPEQHANTHQLTRQMYKAEHGTIYSHC
jgi:hypothetical protein